MIYYGATDPDRPRLRELLLSDWVDPEATLRRNADALSQKRGPLRKVIILWRFQVTSTPERLLAMLMKRFLARFGAAPAMHSHDPTQNMSRRIELLTELNAVPQEAWDTLARTVPGHPFLEWGWLSSLEETGCATAETGWLPQHVTVWQGTDLVAAAPLYVKAHSAGEFVFDWSWERAARRFGVRYYPKLLMAVPFTPARGSRLMIAPGFENEKEDIYDQVVYALDRMAEANDLSSAHVLYAHEDQIDRFEARGFIRRLTVQFQWTNHGYDDFDHFLSCLKAKKRHQIRRERRELAQAGVTVETVTGDAITRDLLRTMYRFHTDTCQRHVWSGQYLTQGFYEILLERFRQHILMVVARRHGEVIGAAFNVYKDDMLYGRYWGCSEEVPFLHFEVCYYHPIQECIRRGLRRFSPGAGGGYKFLRAFEPELEHSGHRIYNKGFAHIVARALEQEREDVRAQAKELLRRSALKRLPDGSSR